jgi:DNA-binding CsgD family transcriptional regulator/PAS domain-containing protein
VTVVPGADPYERATSLLEPLFEAPANPKAWQRFLGALCAALSERSVALLLGEVSPDGPYFLLGHGIDMRRLGPESLLPSADHPSQDEAPVGSVFAIPPESPGFAATHLYKDVLSKEGFAPGPGFCVVLARDRGTITGALLVLARDPSWEPTDDDRALLELLAPYVIRSIMLGLRLNEGRSGIDALLGVFDSLVLGVILLDSHGNVSFANQSAAALLGTSAGLTPPGRAHAAEQKQRTEALRALIRRETGASPSALSYPHPEDGRPLHIVSTPLAWPGANLGADTRFATALFLGDPEGASPGTAQALGPLYGLTPAEERLALALATGLTLAEAAERLGIRLSTARGVLRSVFEKTGTNRQATLVRLILAAVGQVRSESPRG